MPKILVVKGGKIKLEPSGWAWQGFDGEIALDGKQSLLTVEGKPVVIETDFPQTQNLGKNYTTELHTTPGTLQSVLLYVNKPTLTTEVLSPQACVTEKTTGQFQATVAQPALTAKGDPDPIVIKPGQWNVVECGQEIMIVEAAAIPSLLLEAEQAPISAPVSNQTQANQTQGYLNQTQEQLVKEKATETEDEKLALELSYFYQDDTPVCRAPYKITDSSGQEFTGHLSEDGFACITGLCEGPLQIEYDEDARDYKPNKQPQANQKYAPNLTEQQVIKQIAIEEKGIWEVTSNPITNRISLGFQWVWGILQGDFNKDPTTTQIMIGTIVTMIPVVDQLGDARDITANSIALVEEPDEFKNWLILSLTLIGMIPTLGSALKGVFKYTLKQSGQLTKSSLLAVSRQLGKGNPNNFLKNLDWEDLTQKSINTFEKSIDKTQRVLRTLDKLSGILTDKAAKELSERLHGLVDSLESLKLMSKEQLKNATAWYRTRIDKTLTGDAIKKKVYLTITKTKAAKLSNGSQGIINQIKTDELSVDDEKPTQTQPTTDTVETVENILVIVAGTVDPGNMDSLKRANSYKSGAVDSNYYWEENPSFVKKIKEYKEKYPHFHFFSVHGWSGDNAVINRKTAGAYLANRLCGSGGEQCYYPAFKDKKVCFHFIAHSHGGNVINEITRRMADDPKWPENWKVKTIVYLSTPFFQKLHQVNTAKFHDKCKIVNVFNKYDLTQRVIANFSLRQLPGMRESISDNKITACINEITGFDFKILSALLTMPKPKEGWKVWKKWEWEMEPDEGNRLYGKLLRLFNNMVQLLKEVEKIVTQLNREIEFKVAKGLEKKVSNKRQIISDDLRDRLLSELTTIQTGLKPTIQAFQQRMAQAQYPVLGFFDDLHFNAFITPLVELLTINPDTLEGKLSNLLHDILLEQIDEYDNTSNSPNHQLPKPCLQVEVTDEDPYAGLKDQQFERFITQMEKIEARYAQNQAKRDLLDMIFTLIAQLEFVHNNQSFLETAIIWLDRILKAWEKVDHRVNLENTLFEDNMNELLRIFQSYQTIFKERDCGGIVVESDKNKPKRGDLDYLMRISHSISRLELYEEVAKVLEEQIGTS
jgi:hypothetical protein